MFLNWDVADLTQYNPSLIIDHDNDYDKVRISYNFKVAAVDFIRSRIFSEERPKNLVFDAQSKIAGRFVHWLDLNRISLIKLNNFQQEISAPFNIT